MPAKHLRPFSTYLEPEVKRKLERLAAEMGWSAAQLARQIITNYCEEETNRGRRRPSRPSQRRR